MHRSVLRHLLLFLFLLSMGAGCPCLAGAGLTPPGRVAIREYYREDGLPSTALMDITQDHQGLMWFMTEDGTVSYDGKRFRRYGTAEGLESPHITTGSPDGAGRLWVVGRRGLFRMEGNRFVAVPQFGQASIIYLGPWTGGGLLLLDAEGRLWEGAPDRAFRLLPLPFAAGITAVHATHSGELWVACGQELHQRQKDGGWRSFGPEDGLRFDPGEQATTRTGAIRSLVLDGEGTVWARSSRHLWHLPQGAERWEDLGGQVPSTLISNLRAGLGDRLWVLTDRGLYLRTRGRWHRFGMEEGISPLPSHFFEDREGTLWMISGTLKRLVMRGAIQSYGETTGLPASLVWGLHRDREGKLLVGTVRGTVTPEGAKGWRPVEGLAKGMATAFWEAADGTLTTICTPGGFHVRPPGSSRFQAVQLLKGDLGSFVHAIAQDPRGRFWIGSQDTGLWTGSLGPGGAQFTRVQPAGGSDLSWVSCLRLDAEGRLWVASNLGISVLDGEAWQTFGTPEGLPEGGLSSLLVEAGGRFWAAGFQERVVVQGVLDGGHLRIQDRLGPAQGLSDALYYSVFRDARGRLWVGSGAGLDLLEGGGVTHFGRSEGLAGEDTIANRVATEADGDIWVATSNGLSHFRADLWGSAPQPPQVHFSSLRLGRQEALGRPGIAVPHEDRLLEAHFSGLSFLSERAVLCRTRLEGLDQGWMEPDAHLMRIDRLPPGSYRLAVQARIGGGPWGPPVAFAFRVRAPWWGTWWFRLLVSGLALTVVLGLVKWRTSAVRKRAERLQEEVAERTTELASALEELSEANDALRNLSLTDPLTGLRNRRYLSNTIGEDIAQVLRNYRQMERGCHERLAANVDMLLLMVDIDHFKRVNDTYGHAAGDAVLLQTREVLLSCVRDTDTVVRWGGEEFLVVGRSVAGSEASVMAERIRRAMSERDFEIDNQEPLHLTCSIGWAIFPFLPCIPDAFHWEQVLDVADRCLYAAKKSGRDGWVGMAGGDGVRPEDIGEGWLSRLEELGASGTLRLQVSAPEDRRIVW